MEPANERGKPHEGEAPRSLALRWGLEYREAHTLSIDPSALGIIDTSEARRLKALPLQIGVDGPIFVVAEPNEERFAAVRALAGENASFVVVAETTLEALMNSKVFNPGVRRGRPVAPRPQAETKPIAAEPAEARPGSSASPKSPPGSEAPLAPPPPPLPPLPPREQRAEEHRQSRVEEPSPPAAKEPAPRAREPVPAARPPLAAVQVDATANESTELLDNLLNQLAASTGNLTTQVKQLNDALEANQRELREAKEQLAEAHGLNDQYRELIESLRDELATTRALTDATTTRLRDVIRALEAPTLGDALSSGPGESQAGSREANTRIA